MDFEDRFVFAIAYEDIGYPGSVAIHYASGPDAQTSISIPSHILDCV
jgi:hypothetical protein